MAMRHGSTETAQDVHTERQCAVLDNTVVHVFVGYRSVWWAVVLYRISVVLSVGLVWLLGHFTLCARLWTLQKCPLSTADYVHAQDGDGEVHSPTVRCITLLLVVYVYDNACDTFTKLSSMPTHLPLQIYNAKRALELIEQGEDWNIFNPASTWRRHEVELLYGRNDMKTGKLSFLHMIGTALIYPAFIVQYYELTYLYYLGYYLVSTLLFVTLFSAYRSTVRLYEMRKELFQSVDKQRLTPLVQRGRIRAASSRSLVPGDVIVVLPGTAACDMVLLQGNCLVEESNLSGEAAQVRKSSFVAGSGSSKRAYQPDTHHACTIHAGTAVQQVWADDNSDEEVLGMVIRTGLRSTMGDMLRQIVAPLHTRESVTKDTFLVDLCQFCAFALCLQCILFLATAILYYSHHNVSERDVVLRVIAMLLSAVPVSIPTVIVCSNGACAAKLAVKGIQVLDPAKIKTAAAVSVVCFDKTGTLTGSAPELHGMVPVEGGQFTGLQQSAVQWPSPLKQAAAVCNSLTMLRKAEVVGDLADKQALLAVEARFLERDVVSLPLKTPNSRRAATHCTLQILKRFDFEPGLMRSGVIAADPSKPAGTALLFVRGAPSKIKQLLRQTTLPPDYQKVLLEYAGKSFRLMALAMGSMQDMAPGDVAHLDQQQAEARCGPLDLLGLLVLSNHLRPTSKDTVTNLQDKAGIRTLMVTGDYHHTAIAVARGVGMITPNSRLIIIQSKAELQGNVLSPLSSPFASDLHSFRLTANPLGSGTSFNSRQQNFDSKPGSRNPSFTSQLGSRNPSFAVQPDSRNPSFTAKSRRNSVSYTQSVSSPRQGFALTDNSRGALGLLRSRSQIAFGALDALSNVSRWQPAKVHPAPHVPMDRLDNAKTSVLASLPSPCAPHASHGPLRSVLSQRSGPAGALAHLESPAGLTAPHEPAAEDAAELRAASDCEAISCEGLVFKLHTGNQVTELTAQRAVTSIAQGSLQCCVTGAAFEKLLQQADASVVQAVMSSVAVFARMRGQQKGQVMKLLGSGGLHHTLQGQQRHLPGLGATCMYCGDGLNDLIALAAADVGMAVSSSNASAAAHICDTHASVEGVVTVLREARSAQVVKLSAIKYMVAYELLMSIAVNMIYSVEGSSFSIIQRSTVDFVAITLGIMMCLRQAAQQLTPQRPPLRLCTARNFVMLAISVVIISMLHLALHKFLEMQAFYKAGSSGSTCSPTLTLAWVATLNITILPVVSFAVDISGFTMTKSRPETVQQQLYAAFCIVSFLAGPSWFDALNVFNFFHMPFHFMWKAYLFATCFTTCYLITFKCVRTLWDKYG